MDGAINRTAILRNGFGGEDGQEAIDAVYVIIVTFIVFTMQSGFGLLESGMVSRKSESNVMVKNMLDIVIGGFGFWSIGYSFAFGDLRQGNTNSFVSTGNYFVSEQNGDTVTLARCLLHLAFSTTSVTIVSGAVAERIKLSSYMIFIFVHSTFVYSFPAHWMWHPNGWLKTDGAFDFAGGCVVHMTGGAASFVAALVLGPRHGRFSHDDREKYGMACPTNVILGTFFLWWGWIGFNCGATFSVTGGMWRLAVRSGVCTMNGAIGGGIAGILLNLVLYRKRNYILDIPQFASAILGGLVSVTSGAAVINSWHAVIIGFIGGMLANGGISFLSKIHIDDPVGCFGVHWVCGFWGMISTGLFAHVPDGYEHILKEPGLFYGGSGRLLSYNIAAGLAVTVWSAGITLFVFLAMKFSFGVRIGFDKELLGSDEVEHNIIEHVKTIEIKHVLGKHVVHKNVEQQNKLSSAQIGPNRNSMALVVRGPKKSADSAT